MNPGPRSITRELGPLSFRAQVAPASLNEERRTVDLVWTTGARVMRGFFERYWEELSLKPAHVRLDRLRKGAPLLNAHQDDDLSSVIGVVESARIKDGEGTATVRFARAEDDPDADAIFRKVKDGIVRQVSVGYRIHRLEKVEEEADKIPVYRATDWEPYELSMVPMGADAGAGVRAESGETNPCEFVQDDGPPKERAMNPGAGAEANGRAQDEAPAPGGGEEQARAPDLVIVRQEAMALERKRIVDIYRVNRALNLPAAFAAGHVDAGTALDAFRAAAIDEKERTDKGVETGPPLRVTAGEDGREKWLRGAADWLFVRAGVDRLIVEAARQRGEAVRVDPGEFRGLSFVDLARQALTRSGVNTAGMERKTIIGRALTQRSDGGYQATGDFPVLLEGVIHKTLLGAYATAPDTWTLFCVTGSVSDFRPYYRYRLGSLGRMPVVNEGGEFENRAIPDGEKEVISAATKGYIVALTRQALINDDMGAFSQVATWLGRAARLSIEADVYDLLTLNAGLGPDMSDGDTLFHANHDNISTGAALSVTALDADRMAMAAQMDQSGNEYLDLRPSILLVPTGLGGLARVINQSVYDVDPVTTNATNKFQVPNRVVGLFDKIIDTPRLSGTRRYVLASPTIAPVFEVVFLDGQQTPYLETKDGWRVDGVEWKVRLDYGVGAIDWRGAVTNAGTA